MASLTCCLDMHDDDYLGLSMNEQFVNFGVPKKKFKKATAKEVKKNAKHVRELKRRWERRCGISWSTRRMIVRKLVSCALLKHCVC